jgi:hypothetical protein
MDMITIILKGGPADGESHRVTDTCGIFTRYAKAPDARYRNAYNLDAAGQRIFKHWPLKPGEAEQIEGVHHG